MHVEYQEVSMLHSRISSSLKKDSLTMYMYTQRVHLFFFNKQLKKIHLEISPPNKA